jgi:hypothetical protein
MKGLLSGLVALLIAFGGGYYYGKHVEAKAQQEEVDKLNKVARSKEQALATAVTKTADALRSSNEKAKLVAKQRNADIDSGALRLRLPVKTSCPVPTTTDTFSATGSGGGEASAELDRETAKNLIAITEEGDRAIQKLNACIDLYNKAVESQKEIK